MPTIESLDRALKLADDLNALTAAVESFVTEARGDELDKLLPYIPGDLSECYSEIANAAIEINALAIDLCTALTGEGAKRDA